MKIGTLGTRLALATALVATVALPTAAAIPPPTSDVVDPCTTNPVYALVCGTGASVQVNASASGPDEMACIQAYPVSELCGDHEAGAAVAVQFGYTPQACAETHETEGVCLPPVVTPAQASLP